VVDDADAVEQLGEVELVEVAFDERVRGVTVDLRQVRALPGSGVVLRERVDADDVMALFQQDLGKVRADEARRACYEEAQTASSIPVR
jgi:hypothetical protein